MLIKSIWKSVLITCVTILSLSYGCEAQPGSANIYDPLANAESELMNASQLAAAQNKNVFVIIGGNWCRWCRMFDKFSRTNLKVDSTLNANFMTVHINYSKENENVALLEKFGFPQRFGFPVFLILNSEGERIHTQNTGYLEEGEGYSEQKVISFLNDWRPEALDAETYKE